jgi:hypothetical protein
MNKIFVESRIVQSSSFIIFFPPLWLCDGINYLFFLWAQSVIPIMFDTFYTQTLFFLSKKRKSAAKRKKTFIEGSREYLGPCEKVLFKLKTDKICKFLGIY